MRRVTLHLLVAAALALPLANAYAARAYPKYVTLPNLPIDNATVVRDMHAESEFILRDKTEVHQGTVWVGYLDYRKAYGDDERAALEGIVAALQKGGWEVMMRDEPRKPPLATLRLITKDNKVMWASVEIRDQARVLVLEQKES